jgi:hypothetical protein
MRYQHETWKTGLAIAIITVWGIAVGLGLYAVESLIWSAL